MDDKTVRTSYNIVQYFTLSSISSDLHWNEENDLSDYEFKYWTKTEEDSGTKYKDKSSVIFSEKTQDLYAQWDKAWFKFTYDNNFNSPGNIIFTSKNGNKCYFFSSQLNDPSIISYKKDGTINPPFNLCSDIQNITNLIQIDITSSQIKTIDRGSFSYCSNLSSINIPNVLSIGRESFQRCYNLSCVEWTNVKSIGEDAFEWCWYLPSVNIPNVESIDAGAFNNCTSLYLVDIPNILSIGDGAFNSCSKLSSINIPNVTSIGSYTFSYCSNLSSLSVSQQNINFSFLDENNNRKKCGIVMLDENNKNVIWGSMQMCKNVIIPSDMLSIDEGAFSKCENLYSINCQNVEKISYQAFQGCKNLSSINCQHVRSIGVRAFIGCENLSSINCQYVHSIPDNVFTGCKSLYSINISNALSIGYWAFRDCEKLSQIDGPNVLSVGEATFYQCSNLSSVSFPKVTSIGQSTFQYCTELKSISLSSVEKVTTIQTDTFNRYQKLTAYVPNELKDSFKTATNWSSYYVTGNLTLIGV